MYKPLTSPKVIRNKFPGRCCECGHKVQAWEGIAILLPNDAKWKTAHMECQPKLADPFMAEDILREQEAAAAELAKEQAAAEKAAKKALLAAKLGIDFKTVLESSTKQYSWNDHSEWAHPFTGDGTDDEFREMVQTPAQSSWGQLRWSNGVCLVKVDREAKKVYLSESVSLCD